MLYIISSLIVLLQGQGLGTALARVSERGTWGWFPAALTIADTARPPSSQGGQIRVFDQQLIYGVYQTAFAKGVGDKNITMGLSGIRNYWRTCKRLLEQALGPNFDAPHLSVRSLQEAMEAIGWSGAKCASALKWLAQTTEVAELGQLADAPMIKNFTPGGITAQFAKAVETRQAPWLPDYVIRELDDMCMSSREQERIRGAVLRTAAMGVRLGNVLLADEIEVCEGAPLEAKLSADPTVPGFLSQTAPPKRQEFGGVPFAKIHLRRVKSKADGKCIYFPLVSYNHTSLVQAYRDWGQIVSQGFALPMYSLEAKRIYTTQIRKEQNAMEDASLTAFLRSPFAQPFSQSTEQHAIRVLRIAAFRAQLRIQPASQEAKFGATAGSDGTFHERRVTRYLQIDLKKITGHSLRAWCCGFMGQIGISEENQDQIMDWSASPSKPGRLRSVYNRNTTGAEMTARIQISIGLALSGRLVEAKLDGTELQMPFESVGPKEIEPERPSLPSAMEWLRHGMTAFERQHMQHVHRAAQDRRRTRREAHDRARGTQVAVAAIVDTLLEP